MILTRERFWFLRHGETDWNAQGLSQGNVDIPLNANGIAQAHAAAPLLVGRGIASIIASPLSRAHDTAKVAAGLLGLPVHLDEGLRETSFGAQEGQPMVEWFNNWVAGTYTPPDAEPFGALRLRAVAAVNRALEQPGLVLIVAHGALFRALRAAMGLEPNVRTRNAWPMLCEPGAPGERGAMAQPWTLTDAA